MSETSLFMSPMARKKRVYGRYNPNTYRILSTEAESIQTDRDVIAEKPRAQTNLLGQPSAKSREFRHNRPNPNDVSFLRQDVALLNEPICDVHTKHTKQEQHKWWPTEPAEKVKPAAPHTLDTTARSDYLWRGQNSGKNTRHSSNPNATAALGSVPVNNLRNPSGKQRMWQEGVSYEHQFNCRNDPSYPIRGKRHGSFVWDELPPNEAERMLQKYTRNDISTHSSATSNSYKHATSATNITVPSDQNNNQMASSVPSTKYGDGPPTDSSIPTVE